MDLDRRRRDSRRHRLARHRTARALATMNAPASQRTQGIGSRRAWHSAARHRRHHRPRAWRDTRVSIDPTRRALPHCGRKWAWTASPFGYRRGLQNFARLPKASGMTTRAASSCSSPWTSQGWPSGPLRWTSRRTLTRSSSRRRDLKRRAPPADEAAARLREQRGGVAITPRESTSRAPTRVR